MREVRGMSGLLGVWSRERGIPYFRVSLHGPSMTQKAPKPVIDVEWTLPEEQAEAAQEAMKVVLGHIRAMGGTVLSESVMPSDGPRAVKITDSPVQ